MNISTILLIVALPIAALLGYLFRAYIGKIKLNTAEAQSRKIIQDAVREAEAKTKRAYSLKQKNQLLKERNQLKRNA